MTDLTSVPTAHDSQYTFNNSTTEAARQVRLLADILDRHSTQVLERSGVTEGWHCLDLGAGAGTVTSWLAQRVQPTGKVVALDSQPQHIEANEFIEVQAADIRDVDLGTERYDLVHARLLLMHLPERETVLRRAAEALKPGGIMIISDWDCSKLEEMLVRCSSQGVEAFNAYQQGILKLALSNGMSPTWATRIPQAMAEAGLVDINAEIYNRVWPGGSSGCLIHQSNSRQLEAPLLAHGVTRQQLDTLRAEMDNPQTLAWSYPMITATGRRP